MECNLPPHCGPPPRDRESVMKSVSLGAVRQTDSRIPSLDGLRAISISMVLAGHAASGIAALRNRPVLLYTLFNGNRGVSVFFVISGFLITSLLLQEDELKGKISLKYFYLRRAFRILPPFWMFLAGIVLLWRLGFLETTGGPDTVGRSALRSISICSGRPCSSWPADASRYG